MTFINSNKPVILIEYNHSNFYKIYNLIKNNYNVYRYDLAKNSLDKLKSVQIKQLIRGKILEKKYKKNSVNLFYIHKNNNLKNINL